jgi:type I restriction enzyme R subunit
VLQQGPDHHAVRGRDEARFIEEPANLKLLIVVSKLLTGFDAPSCTYIYLDNELRDHNLFQAICRTNRLDGDDKDYGHIVDYKELFGDVQEAIAVYTSDELDIDEGGGDGNVHLKDWLEEGKAQARRAREALALPVRAGGQPREMEQYLHYFCGDANNPNALNETEPLRISFYKAVARFTCAPMRQLAQNLEEAGYSARGRALRKGDRVLRRHSARRSRSTRARSWTSSPTRRTCATSSTPTSRPTRDGTGRPGRARCR